MILRDSYSNTYQYNDKKKFIYKFVISCYVVVNAPDMKECLRIILSYVIFVVVVVCERSCMCVRSCVYVTYNKGVDSGFGGVYKSNGIMT